MFISYKRVFLRYLQTTNMLLIKNKLFTLKQNVIITNGLGETTCREQLIVVNNCLTPKMWLKVDTRA